MIFATSSDTQMDKWKVMHMSPPGISTDISQVRPQNIIVTRNCLYYSYHPQGLIMVQENSFWYKGSSASVFEPLIQLNCLMHFYKRLLSLWTASSKPPPLRQILMLSLKT